MAQPGLLLIATSSHYLESESEDPQGLPGSPSFVGEDWSLTWSVDVGEGSPLASSTCALFSAFSSSPIMAARLRKLNIGSRLPGGGVLDPENVAAGAESTN